jgi:peptidoglycan/xylan/chitin deacetylase (PgdA/CDA1 family)
VTRWPDGSRAAAFFSFDVDGEAWLLGADPRNEGLPVTLSQARYGPRVGVFEILRILRRRGVRVTFFVPSAVAEWHPDTVRAIVGEGHEVGLHGHLHERPDRLTPAEEREITARSIDILSELTGSRPTGYRAPGAEASSSTIAILEEHGISYDSSFMDDVFPYFHPPSGGVGAAPAGQVLEVPIHWTLDDWSYSMVSPYAFPAGQGNPIRLSRDIVEIWTDELRAISAMGGLFVLVQHPQVSGRPGRLQTVDGIIAAAQDTDGLWIASGAEIDAWWRSGGLEAPTGAERLAR